MYRHVQFTGYLRFVKGQCNVCQGKLEIPLQKLCSGIQRSVLEANGLTFVKVLTQIKTTGAAIGKKRVGTGCNLDEKVQTSSIRMQFSFGD